VVRARPAAGRAAACGGRAGDAAVPGVRPPRPLGRSAAADPEKDEEFLKQVRARAEEQRKRYEAQKKRDQERDQEREPEEGTAQ
jgi:hypothetical protein